MTQPRRSSWWRSFLRFPCLILKSEPESRSMGFIAVIQNTGIGPKSTHVNAGLIHDAQSCAEETAAYRHRDGGGQWWLYRRQCPSPSPESQSPLVGIVCRRHHPRGGVAVGEDRH